MTANTNLERRVAEHYASEPPLRAPDRVLHAALATIETTNQRRGLAALRRSFDMPSYIKLAAAAVILIAVGGFALWQLAPPGPGDQPPPAPSQSTAATGGPPPSAAPTRPAPTTYVPGALTQTFTSDFHGVSLRYPENWAAKPATEPWPEGALPNFTDPTGDKVHDDAALQDHLFLTIVSRPLDGASLDEWFTDHFADQGCTPRAGGPINGADRVLRGDCTTDVALASGGGRGYVFELRASPDDVELRTLDTADLLDSILATVQLLPEDAVDE